jgi:hypothetical protein
MPWLGCFFFSLFILFFYFASKSSKSIHIVEIAINSAAKSQVHTLFPKQKASLMITNHIFGMSRSLDVLGG